MLPLENMELYAFGGYSNRTALGNGFYRGFNEAEKNVTQVYPDGFLPRIDKEAQDISTAFGLRGELNNDWSFDVSATYGENEYDFHSNNTINDSYAAEYLALNPSASDQDIASNSGPTSGYSGGFRYVQLTFNADISGAIELDNSEDLFVSFGAEYRQENYEIVAGEEASYASGANNSSTSFPSVNDSHVFAGCGFQAYPGLRPDAANDADRNSYALYLDLEQQITEQWNLGAALRFEDFSEAGSKLIGKLSSRYELTESLAIRGVLSTRFRAPSLQQSAYTAFTTNLGEGGVLLSSFTATAGSAFPSALGVDGLKLETSKNLSLGMVYDVNSALSISLDAYRVKIDDRITLGSLQNAGDVSFNTEAVAALNATGAVQGNYFSNAVNSTTQGLDLVITYQTELQAGNLQVTLAGNLNETEIDSVNSPEGVPEKVALDDLQRSFLTNGQPKQRATLTFDYSKEAWSGVVRENYYGETDIIYFGNDHIGLPGFLSPTGSFQPTSVVESAVLIDVNLAYQLTDTLQLSAGINNLFDKTPDELGEDEALNFITNGAFKYPVRALPYGFDGMTYYARINFSF
jgi:iron complex outermembrane receptor protein